MCKHVGNTVVVRVFSSRATTEDNTDGGSASLAVGMSGDLDTVGQLGHLRFGSGGRETSFEGGSGRGSEHGVVEECAQGRAAE